MMHWYEALHKPHACHAPLCQIRTKRGTTGKPEPQRSCSNCDLCRTASSASCFRLTTARLPCFAPPRSSGRLPSRRRSSRRSTLLPTQKRPSTSPQGERPGGLSARASAGHRSRQICSCGKSSARARRARFLRGTAKSGTVAVKVCRLPEMRSPRIVPLHVFTWTAGQGCSLHLLSTA